MEIIKINVDSVFPNWFRKTKNKSQQIWNIQGEITFDQNEINGNTIIFRDFIFDDNISFKDINFDSEIIFENCDFNKNLWFSFSSCDSKNKINNSILFNNCKINNLSFFESNTFQSNIRVVNSEFNEFIIDSLNLSGEKSIFQISNTIIKSNFTVYQLVINSSINLSNVKFMGNFHIDDFKCDSFIISDCIFDSKVNIIRGKRLEELNIYKSVFNEEFSSIIIESHSFKLTNNIFNKSATFRYFNQQEEIKELKKIFIDSCTFENGVLFWGNLIENKELEINDVIIHCSNNLIGQIEFLNVRIKKAFIAGTKSNAYLIFDKTNFENLHLKNFINSNNLHFKAMNLNSFQASSLIIQDSILGITHFTNCDFDSFEKICISDSNLIDIITSNINWFHPNKLMKFNEEKQLMRTQLDELIKFNDSKIDSQKKREIFRQLKYALGKQGDRIQELVFKKYELESFKAEIKESNKIGDRIILNLSQTNDFGQNWLKPLYILAIVTLIFGFIQLITVNSQIHDFCKVYCNYEKVFFCLLDPTHKLKDIFEGIPNISTVMHGLDIFYRAIYAYLIFQSITAFRKYIK